MPASEETYRRQPALHLVFAISSIAMTLSIVWMIMADHLRPWKQVQRDFQLVERKKLELGIPAVVRAVEVWRRGHDNRDVRLLAPCTAHIAGDRASAEFRPSSSESVRSMPVPASCVGDDVDRSG